MTLEQYITENIDQYNEMHRMYFNGEITVQIWSAYCNKFLTCILGTDDIRAIFERMKNDQTTN